MTRNASNSATVWSRHVERNKWQGEGSGEDDARVTWRSGRKREGVSRNPKEAQHDVMIVRQWVAVFFELCAINLTAGHVTRI